MGNVFSTRIWITGEVDYRVIKFDAPLMYKTNLCLRWPTTLTSLPDLSEPIYINYLKESSPFKHVWVSSDIYNRCFEPSGFDLRTKGNTKVVLLEGDIDIITGQVNNIQLLKEEIVPIVHNYAMK